MPETITLFDKVAKRYDSLNTFLSLGMDRLWRKRLVKEMKDSSLILDIATGTAEVALETANKLNNCYIVGVDPSSEMLLLAKKKIKTTNASSKITLAKGKAENLPFKNDTFDSVTTAFGIRNTVDPLLSLLEMKRVLKTGGKLGVLEFATPQNNIFAPLYLTYFKHVLPLVGSVFGTRKEYKYLSDSTSQFPQRKKFIELMEEAGLAPEKSIELTLGIVIIYIGIKP